MEFPFPAHCITTPAGTHQYGEFPWVYGKTHIRNRRGFAFYGVVGEGNGIKRKHRFHARLHSFLQILYYSLCVIDLEVLVFFCINQYLVNEKGFNA